MYKGRTVVLLIFLIEIVLSPGTSAQQTKRSFTVADDIELTTFGFETDPGDAVQFSPDGNYLAVYAERGRLDLNRPEDLLRFYRIRDIESFLKNSDEDHLPTPVWTLLLSTASTGPIISRWRWLSDSSAIAFLQSVAGGKKQLALANLKKKTVEQLRPPSEEVRDEEDIRDFDIRDRRHYVYTARNSMGQEEKQREAPAIVGTGRNLDELIFSDDPRLSSRSPQSLWAVVGSRRFQVKNDIGPIIPEGPFALSPDGNSIVTTLPVAEVPPSWEKLYPPYDSDAPIRAGHNTAEQYVQLDLLTGSTRPLTDAPASNSAGGWAVAVARPAFSTDGQQVILPGTFLKAKDGMPSAPCVGVVDIPSKSQACVDTLKSRKDAVLPIVEGVRFVGSNMERVMVVLTDTDSTRGATEYERLSQTSWHVVRETKGSIEIGRNGLQIFIKEGLNEPELLIASNGTTARVIWDPNPQLKNIELGEASIYNWKDGEGRGWKGGLYKPVGYQSGQRYPLLIQTHSFDPLRFLPSGAGFPGYAARQLAAAGIAVLQVEDQDRCENGGPSEAPCAVSDYEGAVKQLASDGLVDEERVGIIGFSRTCLYVMQALTIKSSLHLKAASITDGVMADYLQYLIGYGDSLIGAPPFGDGLQQWLKRSPGFNLDKVTTPLLVNAEGREDVLFMWQPYTGLRALHKPTEFVMLNTDEHVLTNPAVRMASQSGSVDWFRFWLQGYEDPDPAKSDQYKRWRELKKMQSENEQKSARESSRSSN